MSLPDFGSRLSRLRGAFEEKGLDSVLINSINDIYYYTGKGISREDFGFLFVTKDSSELFVSTLNNDLEGPGVRIVRSMKDIRDELKKAGKLGFDEKNTSVLMFKRLKTGSWSPFSDSFKALRMVKDSYEIMQIRKACHNTLRVFSSLKPQGKTEFGLATDILSLIRSLGDTPAFDPIVASGKRSAFIHTQPGKGRIARGLVIVDVGLCHSRYKSDLTRVFQMNPSRQESEMFEQCRSIQSELMEMARPGTMFSEIQKRFEGLMKSMGHTVMHGFGHGVGLSVHERPGGKDVLEKGMVFTVEPGIYKKGVGGCRVEDMILVADKPVILSA